MHQVVAGASCAPSVAVVFVCPRRYEQMLGGTELIESHMHENQIAHLNAEIAQKGTYMADVTVWLRWLKSTYFFTRMKRNPAHYKIGDRLDEKGLEAHLTKLLMDNLRRRCGIPVTRLVSTVQYPNACMEELRCLGFRKCLGVADGAPRRQASVAAGVGVGIRDGAAAARALLLSPWHRRARCRHRLGTRRLPGRPALAHTREHRC